MPPAIAAVAIVAIGVGASVASGALQASAARRAAAAQERTAREAIRVQEAARQQQRQDALPFIQTGQRAIGTLSGTATPFQSVAVDGRLPDDVDPSTIGLPTFENDQLFQFQQEQGERAINRALAARGQFFSGAAFESLSDFNRQLAGEESRRERERLLSLSSLGSNASFGLAAVDERLTRQTTGSLGNVGNAQASGILGNTQGVTNAIQGSANSAIQGIGGANQAGLF